MDNSDNWRIQSLFVRVGSNKVDQGDLYYAVGWRVHEDYDDDDGNFYNDIAIIYLDRIIKFAGNDKVGLIFRYSKTSLSHTLITHFSS